MAAYQCLNCEQIEHADEQCCSKPDLFCINDMPGEIRRLRAEVAELRDLVRELDEHEGAEGWSEHLRPRIAAVLGRGA